MPVMRWVDYTIARVCLSHQTNNKDQGTLSQQRRPGVHIKWTRVDPEMKSKRSWFKMNLLRSSPMSKSHYKPFRIAWAPWRKLSQYFSKLTIVSPNFHDHLAHFHITTLLRRPSLEASVLRLNSFFSKTFTVGCVDAFKYFFALHWIWFMDAFTSFIGVYIVL